MRIALLVDLFFFFFQAEDGIRDLTVTGVQTCALPISLTRYLLRQHLAPLGFALTALTGLMLLQQIAKQFGNLVGKGLPWGVIIEVRSEERRVGKECRSRWSPYH